MAGQTKKAKKALNTILQNSKADGAVAIEINAGKFAASCDLTQDMGVVCDVLRDGAQQIIKHPQGESGIGVDLIVRYEIEDL